jgi:hypothetical protein
MAEKKNYTPNHVPFSAYEGAMARAEREQKRYWVLIIILILALLVSNMAWLIYENQFDTYSYEQDGNGVNNINTGMQGDVINGTTFENPCEEGA